MSDGAGWGIALREAGGRTVEVGCTWDKVGAAALGDRGLLACRSLVRRLLELPAEGRSRSGAYGANEGSALGFSGLSDRRMRRSGVAQWGGK